MKRADDFNTRREQLKDLTDEQLYERFWSLTEQIVDPLVELAKTHTSSSIERSVLLRMGFSSLEASQIAEEGLKAGLLGKGLGNVVLKYGKYKNIPYLEAGRELASGKGWIEVSGLFGGEN